MHTTTPDPDMDWYLNLSRERGTRPRCPFASVERCPRYYQSLSLLGQAGSTKIPPNEDDRLKASWEKSDLWPRTEEGATSIFGSDGRTSGFSNFCPEVSYDRFHLFASGLYRHADEIDLGLAHKRLNQEGVPGTNWQWSWAGISPMHFTECPLYSPLTSGTGLPPETIMNALMEPERISLVEGLNLLERHLSTEEAKTRLRQAFVRKAFRQEPLFALSYDEAEIDWATGLVKIPRKRDRFCPTFSRTEFNAYFFEEKPGRARGGGIANDEITEEGRKARFEQWEKLGADAVKQDLATGGYRLIGGPPQVRDLAREWIRMKEEASQPSVQENADEPLNDAALGDIRATLATIRDQLSAVTVSNTVKAEIDADITQIEVEVDRPTPRRRFMKLYLESLRDNLAKAAGAGTAAALLAAVGGLLAKYFEVF